MRILAIFALCGASLTAMADELTIERIVSDPNLNGPGPRDLRIAPDGAHVTFLRGKADDQNQLDLWEYNVAENSARMLVDSRLLDGGVEQVSRSERDARERQRIAALKGIVHYRWAADSRRLLFTLGDAVYLYTLDAAPNAALQQLTRAGGDVFDARISPKGRYVSFVSAKNLWAIDLKTRLPRQLTHDGGKAIHNGEAEFIAQEEMGRSEGYWWAPDDSAIAFERYDESRIPITKRIEIYGDRTDAVEQRYPAAGDPNALVALAVVSPDGGRVRWLDLGKDPDIYLARVDWLPDGRRLAFQRQARNQRQLDLILVDTHTREQRTLLTETSRTWVGLNSDLRFLEHQDSFVWASERSGHRLLYLYGLDGSLRRALTPGGGDVDRLLALDEHKGKVYFAANLDDPLEQQIYAAPLDGSGAAGPERVSRASGWHEAVFAENANLYVDTWSDPATPPQVSLRHADGELLTALELNALDAQHPYWPYRAQHALPEFGTLKSADGQPLYWRMYKPANFDPQRRYPVCVRFYGGPGRQLVTRAWSDLFDQYLAQHGYLVFSLDNRGTPRRGRAFEDPIFRRLGDVEVQDQLAGIAFLKTQPYVDAAHIGVFGWSYGGYLALMLLAKASDQIAAGVAVAPVTDWRLYDSHYTERFLDAPAVNAQGYDASSVFAHLGGLTAPLLLAHGMADDNVLFVNSTKLMAALQARGVQFELMTYPGGKHSLGQPALRQHAYTAIARFLDVRLKRPEGAN